MSCSRSLRSLAALAADRLRVPLHLPWGDASAGLLACLLVPGAMAQEWVGFGRNCPVELSGVSRNGLGTGAGQVLTRIDSDEHTGWGNLLFGFRAIQGVQYAIDDVGVSPEAYDINFYDEGALDFPGVQVPFAVALPGPPVGTWCMTVTRLAPIFVPITATGDTFLSFDLPANLGWPLTDGLSIGLIRGSAAALDSGPVTNFDRPGARLVVGPAVPASSHGLLWPTSGVAAYATTRQHWFDIQHVAFGVVPGVYEGAGGVGVTWNTQIPVHNAAWGQRLGGTADFLSGTNPNLTGAFGPPGNGEPIGRCDTVGMEMHMATPPLSSTIVIFTLSAGSTGYPFFPESPITLPPVLAPAGSTGVFCINPASLFVSLVVFPSGNSAEIRYTVPCNVNFAGLDVQQQGFAFDFVNGLIHACPCDRMRL